MATEADDATFSKEQKAEMIINALSEQTPIHETFMSFIRNHQHEQNTDKPLLRALDAAAVSDHIQSILAASLAEELDNEQLDTLLRQYSKPHIKKLLSAARRGKDPATIIARLGARERRELESLSDSDVFHEANAALQTAIENAKGTIAEYLIGILHSIISEHYNEDEAARFWRHRCINAYQASDFLMAFFSCTAAATQRCSECEYYLGEMYRKGAYPPKNISKARELHIRSALSGNHRSAHALGIMSIDSAKSDDDLLRAIHWLMLAGELGSAESRQALPKIRRRLNAYPDTQIQKDFRRFKQAMGIQ